MDILADAGEDVALASERLLYRDAKGDECAADDRFDDRMMGTASPRSSRTLLASAYACRDSRLYGSRRR